MESNVAGFDFTLLQISQTVCLHDPTITDLDVDLVTAQDNRNVFAHSLEIAVPVGYVLVCDPRRDVKHDDSALPLDVVSITQTSELFLPGSVPDVEADCAEVGVERQRVNLDSQSR